MKRVLTLITTIVLAMTAFADNRIYIEDSDYDVGTDIVLPVYMTNTDSITAFQFDLFLPEDLTLGEEGITLDTEKTTTTAHDFTFHKVDDGWYRVICYSTGLSLFKGSEGAIARIHIATLKATGSYEISISDIEMTKPDLTKITCDDVTAHIKVGSGSSADNVYALKRFMEKYEESVGVYNNVKVETVDKLLDEEGNVINKKYGDLVTEFITELDNYKKELDDMKSDAEEEYASGVLSDNIEMYIATLTYSDKSIQEAQKAFLMAMENLDKYVAFGEVGTCIWYITNEGQLVIMPEDGESGDLPEEGWCDYKLMNELHYEVKFHDQPWVGYIQHIKSIKVMDGVNATTCAGLFANHPSVESIDLTGLNTKNTTSMACMFTECTNLRNIEFGDINTENVTDMFFMFEDCPTLEHLDLSKFNTSKVTNMHSMFVGCNSLTSLNVSSFDTKNVADFGGMFAECYNLDSLNIRNFNTESATMMYGMFSGCSKLTSLDVSKFNTSNVTNMYGMFSYCNNLKSLDLSSFNTEKTTDMFGMFGYCENLETLDLTNFNTVNIESTDSIFYGCDKLTTIISSNPTPSSLKIGTFESFENRANCTLVVPEGSKALYAAADGWNELGKILDGTEPVGPEIPADAIASGEVGTCIWYITSDNELVIAPADGVSGDLPEWRYDVTYGSTSPWSEYRDSIYSAKILSGVNAKSCQYMFAGLNKMQTIDLSSFNTQNVTDMGGMFYGCSALTSLDLRGFNTQNVRDMESMFNDCSALTSLDLSNFNTQNVTSMGWMFYGCSSLTSLDLSSFDTQNVTEMWDMFHDCSSLTSLDLSSFNTQNVINMPGMFEDCSALTTLDLSSFNTQNVINMISVFNGCSSLTSLDLRSFNTQNVTDMGSMFCGCSALTSLDLRSFNTQNVTDMRSMFKDCSALTLLDLSSFNTQNVLYMTGMFNGCSTLTSINLDNFNTENVKNMAHMFNGCSTLTSLDLSSFNTKNVTSMPWMFFKCSALTSIDLSNLNTENVTDMGIMFYGCSSLTSLNLTSFNTENVTDMWGMFGNCSSLISLDLSSFNTQNVTDMIRMFDGCSALTSLNLSNFNTQNVIDMTNMFYGCYKLSSIISDNETPSLLKAGTFESLHNRANCQLIVPEGSKALYSAADGWNELGKIDESTNSLIPADAIASGESGTCIWYITSDNELVIAPANGVSGDLPENGWGFDQAYVSNAPWNKYRDTIYSAKFMSGVNAKSCKYMFYGMHKMEAIDLSNFNTGNVRSMNSMFSYCTSLTSLDLSSLNTQNVMDMYCMFENCSALTSLNFSNPKTQNVTNMSRMFSDCSALTSLDLSNLNTKNVTNMELMFSFCSALTSLNLSNFNTQNVKDMGGMFNYCKSLTSLDLSNFDTQNVTDMGVMFRCCFSLTSLDLSNFDTQNVTDMGEMFHDCSSLTSLNLSSFDTQNVTYMYSMFTGCSSIRSLDLSNFNTQNAKNMRYLFNGCDSLKTIISNNEVPSQLQVGTFGTLANRANCTLLVPEGTRALYKATDGWNELGKIDDGTNSLIPADAIASGETGTCIWYITSEGELVIAPADGVSGDLPEEGWEHENNYTGNSLWTSTPWWEFRDKILSASIRSGVNAVSCLSMFCGLKNMNNIDLSNFNTQNVTNMSYMFYDCSSLTSLDLSSFNTQNVTDMARMFECCSSLTSLDLSNFNTQNVTRMYYMFEGCSSLTSLNLSNFNTQNVTGMRGMFQNCYSLTSLDLSSFNTQKVTVMDVMFNLCTSLTSLDLSNFNTQNVTDMGYMFCGCSSLTSLDLSNFNMQNVTDMDDMFSGCTYLSTIVSNSETPSPLKVGTFDTFANRANCTLQVPVGTKALYAAADGWNELGKIDDGTPDVDPNVLAQGESGSCTWTLNKDGELVIAPNGENGGELDNWVAKGEKAPWADQSDEVRRVTIEEGVGGLVDGMLGDLNNMGYVNWNTNKSDIPQGIFGTEENNVIIYAPQGVDSDRDHNVVINGVAENIILKDGYPLEVPEAFEADYIYYVRDFSKATKTGRNYGWETIVLPYDVQHFVHESKGNLAPFGSEGTTKRPFWLSLFTHNGSFAFANEMKANVPYIIAMPNDSVYDESYILRGKVAFISYNTTVYPTDEAESIESERATMYCSYQYDESPDYYVINDDIFDGYMPGAVFGSGLTVKPFSAYLNIYEKEWMANKRVFIINVNDNDNVNGIVDVNDNVNDNDRIVYDLNGIRINPSQMKRGRVYLKLKNSKIEKFKY